MPNTEQNDDISFRMNILNALRAPLQSDLDRYSFVNLVPPSAALSSITDENLSEIHFMGGIASARGANLIQWNGVTSCDGPQPVCRNLVTIGEQRGLSQIQIQPSLASKKCFPRQHADLNKHNVNKHNVIVSQPTLLWWISADGQATTPAIVTKPEPLFDFAYTVIASAVETLAAYVSESERKAREAWKRFCRKHILSSAVSKNGHLSFLVPRYRQVCLETAAKDQVIHLEVVALAEQHDAPAYAMGQMLISGGKSWTRMKSSLLNLLSGCSESVLPLGFIGAGLNSTSAVAL